MTILSQSVAKECNVFSFKETKDSIIKSIHPVLFHSAVMNVLVLASPLYMIQLFDRVLSSRSMETLAVLTLVVIAAHLLFSYLDGCRLRTLQTIGAWCTARLGPPVLRHAIDNASKRQKSINSSSLDDVRTVRDFVGSPSIIALLDAPWVLLFLITLWILHPAFGIIALLGASTLFLLALINNSLTKKLIQRDAAAKSQQDSVIKTSIDNANTVVAMGMSTALCEKLVSATEKAQACREKSEQVNSRISSLSRFIRLSLQTLIMATGAVLAINGDVASGAMIAASVMLGRALAPVEQSITGWRSAVKAHAAWARIESTLQAKNVDQQKVTLPAPRGALVLNNVSLQVPSAKRPVLQAINCALQPGQSMAVFGSCGAGKSSLIELMMGLNAPSGGEVRLDGASVCEWPREHLGQYIGYLPQSVDLLAGSVAEIICRHGEINSGKIIEASTLAGVHELILELPNGYQTSVAQGAHALSGGIRQRIALARAVYGDIRLLVLDEPTSNLDQPGEQALLNVLKTMRDRKVTVVVVTHKPQLFRHMDLALRLERGRIEKLGPMLPPSPQKKVGSGDSPQNHTGRSHV